MDDLDELLHRSDPARGRLTAADGILARLSAAAAVTPRRSWWKRPRIVIPAALGVAVLASGAAAVVPMALRVNHTWAEVDVRIPIRYVTDTGVTIECEYGLYVGEPQRRTPADEELAAFLRAEDWNGIGQEIYDTAMREPFVPGPNDDIQNDTQAVRDSFSFQRALSVIDQRIPEHLMHDVAGGGGTSTCTGQLR